MNKFIKIKKNEQKKLILLEFQIEGNFSLKIISDNCNKENCIDNYATRNIYNRNTFLILKYPIKIYPNKYRYNLIKENSYLKITRVLFKYFNNVDKNKYNEIINNREYIY